MPTGLDPVASPITVSGLPHTTSGSLPEERYSSCMKEPASGGYTPSAGHTSSAWVAMYGFPSTIMRLMRTSFS